jgi:hypothetical protein
MPNRPIYFVSFPPLSKKLAFFSHSLAELAGGFAILVVLGPVVFFGASTPATFLFSGKSTSSPFFRFHFLSCISSILVFPSC